VAPVEGHLKEKRFSSQDAKFGDSYGLYFKKRGRSHGFTEKDPH
jgi:hypothetical protein